MDPYVRARAGVYEGVNYQDIWTAQGTQLRQEVSKTRCPTDAYLNGFRNPRWRSQVAHHVSATTQCYGVVRDVFPGSLSCSTYNKYLFQGKLVSDSYKRWGSLWNRSSVPTATFSEAEKVSLEKTAWNSFLRKVYTNATSQQYGASLLEARELVRLMKRPLASMIDLLEGREIRLKRKYRIRGGRASFRSSQKRLGDWQRAIGDSWLEAQFALKPLVSDVVGLAQHLRDRWEMMEIVHVPAIGSATSEMSTKTSQWISLPNSDVQRKIDTTITVTKTVKFRGKQRLDPMKGNWSYGDMERLGLGLDNWLPTLWEITPWSFLVDYFVDVGGLIESFCAPQTQLRWVFKTVRLNVETVIDDGIETRIVSRPPNQTQWFMGACSFSPARGIYREWERTVQNPYALPRWTISVHPPGGKQIANMVALASSRSAGRFSRF